MKKSISVPFVIFSAFLFTWRTASFDANLNTLQQIAVTTADVAKITSMPATCSCTVSQQNGRFEHSVCDEQGTQPRS